MDTPEIVSRLKDMIVDRLFLKVAPADLKTDVSLIDEYGVDSVCLLELVVGLEDEFGIVIEDGDFSVENFSSVDAIAAFVRERIPAS